MTDSTSTAEATAEQRKAAVQALIAKCWNDETFKQALMADPLTVIRAQGIDLPDGITVKVHDTTANHFVLALPVRPSDLSDEDLDMIAGGSWDSFVDKLYDFLKKIDPQAFPL
jgi:hypothetical protein